jgi:cytochrome P450
VTDFESRHARDSEEDEHGTLPFPTIQNSNTHFRFPQHERSRMLILHQRCVKEITAVKTSIASGRDISTRKTIFHQLLDPAATPGHVVPSVEDLTDEAFTTLTAAADTTGHAMAILTYYVVSSPSIYRTLTTELKTAFPSHDHNYEQVKNLNYRYTTLEKLPYLTGVIKEGLRLSYGTPGSLPRTINTPTATFNWYTVPKGTVVGMSTYLMHHNPDLFPDPDTFDPGRWLEPVTSKRLEKYLVSFGRGATMCVGMQYVASFPFNFLFLPFPTFSSLFLPFPSVVPISSSLKSTHTIHHQTSRAHQVQPRISPTVRRHRNHFPYVRELADL